MRFNRIVFTLIALACVAVLGVALYMEHMMGLEPCPLCMLQRMAFVGVGVVALLAALIGPSGPGVRLGGGLMMIPALAGLGLAGRQLWLQNLPADQVPPCGPGYDYLRETFPLTEVVWMALEGDGSCAEIQWQFLGLSIPGWSFVLFALAALAGVGLLVVGKGRRHGLLD
ncbi:MULTISPECIES: disulfide bond formation protein B [Halomonadaceae]|jgi:disulfide bond formation protein DsbB|uniref:Disulfide bond formation protein B n=1 Tax=Vreelandella halophila TaxID=86177 RepID=A0A9X4YBD2_9GAMM|nr:MULTISPECIES: disulfide bond formation protein B [Halomonas]MYL26145.1 disulfide bond formation protein B [Halomonas utahensis]MYL73293.1 disulfide bond formation protein B [Halomonas sp. 22501_18_FS]